MKKINLIIALIPLILIVLFYIRHKSNSYKEKNTDETSKVYSIANVDADFSGPEPVFKNISRSGRGYKFFIIPLAEDNYVLINFTWPVIQNAVAEVHGPIYWFDQKRFFEVKPELKYDPSKNILEGVIPWSADTFDGKEVKKVVRIHFESEDMAIVVGADAFNKINKLKGFENAKYVE